MKHRRIPPTLAITLTAALAVAGFLLLSTSPPSSAAEAHPQARTVPPQVAAVRAIAQPEGDREVVSNEGAVSKRGDRGSLVLRALWDGNPIPEVQLSCRSLGTSQEHLVLQTDAAGAIALPIGSWSLVPDADLVLADNDIEVGPGTLVVWADRRVRFTTEVLSEDLVPVAGATATIWKDGQPTSAKAQTDSAGHAELYLQKGSERIALVVFEGHHEPAFLDVDVATVAGEGSVVQVVLKRCLDTWTLALEDRSGKPISAASVAFQSVAARSPVLDLGTTDAQGRLEIAGDWMRQEHFVLLGGTAFPFRAAPMARTPSADTRGAVALTAPRQVDCTIAIHGQTDSAVDWTICEPRASALGTGVLPRFQRSESGTRFFTAKLPAEWPVRLLGRRKGLIVFDEVVNVSAGESTLSITLRQPASRMLTVQSLGSPIRQIRIPGSETAVIFDTQNGAEPSGMVQVEVAADAFASAEVRFDNGASVFLAAPPGTADAVVTLNPPEFLDVDFVARDRRDVAICDATLSLSRTTDTAQEQSSTPGWTWMFGNSDVRAALDGFGRARVRLLPGRYRVSLCQLLGRKSMGQRWTADNLPSIAVDPSAPREFRLQFAKARRIRIELSAAPGVSIPSSWQLVAGDDRLACRGASAEFWITEDPTQLDVVTDTGVRLGSAAVMGGGEPVVMRVPLDR